jgi:polyisoprenyl-phosphate glycosyltransferase
MNNSTDNNFRTNDLFLSIVIVNQNYLFDVDGFLKEAQMLIHSKVEDYEFIIVDNGSLHDQSSLYSKITIVDGFPNLQVFILAQEVDEETAICVGLENALGDCVLIINPLEDDLSMIDDILLQFQKGNDVVFIENLFVPNQEFLYRFLSQRFEFIFRLFTGVNLKKEVPKFRLLGKRVVNYILQFPVPSRIYRLIPASAGFSTEKICYSNTEIISSKIKITNRISKAFKLLINTTFGPLRMVNIFCFFGAISNILYSIYVVVIAIIKDDIAPGWVTMSLQLSGMFFLISLVLLIFGEYIINIKSVVDQGPLYFVSKEYTSKVFTKRSKLNVQENDLML